MQRTLRLRTEIYRIYEQEAGLPVFFFFSPTNKNEAIVHTTDQLRFVKPPGCNVADSDSIYFFTLTFVLRQREKLHSYLS